MKNLKLLYRAIFLGIFLPTFLNAQTLRIMPLGDSVTYGGDFAHVGAGFEDSSIAYRGALWTKLKENGIDVDFVGSQQSGTDYLVIDDSFDTDNEGHNGFRADEIASNVSTYLNNNPTDIVLLHIGTNDFDQGGTTITETVLDVVNILNNIDRVSKDIKVIIAKIINHQENDHNITDYNNEIETMVKNRISNGDILTLVDMETGANIDYTTDMVDNLHPNTQGYAKIADVWYDAISETDNRTNTSVSSDSVDAWSPLSVMLFFLVTLLTTRLVSKKESI